MIGAADLDTFVVVLRQFAVAACIAAVVVDGTVAVELCDNTAVAVVLGIVVERAAAAVHDSIGPERARPERQNSIVASLAATTIGESDWGPDPNRPENSNLSLVETLLAYI